MPIRQHVPRLIEVAAEEARASGRVSQPTGKSFEGLELPSTIARAVRDMGDDRIDLAPWTRHRSVGEQLGPGDFRRPPRGVNAERPLTDEYTPVALLDRLVVTGTSEVREPSREQRPPKPVRERSDAYLLEEKNVRLFPLDRGHDSTQALIAGAAVRLEVPPSQRPLSLMTFTTHNSRHGD